MDVNCLSAHDRLRGRASARRAVRAASGASRLTIVIVVLVNATIGQAAAVVGGTTVSIAAAPWAVVVRQAGRMICTGVIIDPDHVLTAEHCMMPEDSAKPEPTSEFTIEAGVSNFRHPHASDDPQTRAVSAERLISGYTPTNKVTNGSDPAGHDLAVLTLSHALNLSGKDASRLSTEPRRACAIGSHATGDGRFRRREALWQREAKTGR
jgi:hypothetical protein